MSIGGKGALFSLKGLRGKGDRTLNTVCSAGGQKKRSKTNGKEVVSYNKVEKPLSNRRDGGHYAPGTSKMWGLNRQQKRGEGP